MRKTLIILGIIVLLFAWNIYFPLEIITGTYRSNNTQAILEGPGSVEELILYENQTFFNQSWGLGQYEISGQSITFHYNSSGGRMGNTKTIYRPFFIGRPRINLNRDLGFYYSKIN